MRTFKVITLLRHLVAILVLPFVVTVMMPRWVVRWYGLDPLWAPDSFAALAGRFAGGLLFLAGFGLFAWCLYLFAARGKGTLAPWDPPRHLVVTGPYGYVRNPMISGVLLMLAGETLLSASRSIGWWTLTFFALNQVYFLISEEPMLRDRFGEPYRVYCDNVGRWIPRVTPFELKNKNRSEVELERN